MKGKKKSDLGDTFLEDFYRYIDYIYRLKKPYKCRYLGIEITTKQAPFFVSNIGKKANKRDIVVCDWCP